MSVHKAYIVDATTDAPVEVELHDDLSVDVLLDVEDQWAPDRQALRSKLKSLRIPREAWPESLHWDWGRKSLQLAVGDLGAELVRKGTDQGVIAGPKIE